MIIPILIGIAALSVLVIAHELGHFFAAKKVGVRVEEFGLGFPPRLITLFTLGETRYSLNAIPFGAFNRMTGEEDPGDPRSLTSKSASARFLVYSGGPLMSILIALLLFSIAFMVPRNVVTEPVTVKTVAENSPAASAGIESGDTLLLINNEPINNTFDLLRSIQLNLGDEITMLVQHRDSTTEEVQVIPRWKPPEGEGAIGIEIDLEAAQMNRTTVSQNYPFWEAIPMGATALLETLVLYKDGIASLFVGTASVEMTGPVGIVRILGEVAKSGISPLLEIAAIISLLIAITMLFPIPALDGGKIAFVLLEWARRGKRVSAKTEGLVHFVGFVMLIGVMVVVTYQEIIRIISGESLFP